MAGNSLWPFWGLLSDPFQWLSDLQLGDDKNHFESPGIYIHKSHQKFDFNQAETWCFSTYMAKKTDFDAGVFLFFKAES